ncbi:PREDICTED: leukocyte immunoglobulin-like receptor subfamily B member 3-like [Odobenus rosmarus divergens]|uniref:Leukocyte immunoglobulin-like receptor subfamily B member 3-like n=1 Tax=Odobenus rosmarus divergens TaxID=9708 RepID=A0A9B0H0K7_ODORO
MTHTLTALLCLGLSVGPRTRVQAGTLPKPTIWAEPGSVIPWRTSVTIWCQGSLEAQEYCLRKEGNTGTWDKPPALEPGDKAKFSIRHMADVHAGQYLCSYRSPTGWSEPSDPLELVVTGLHGKPTLIATPSPVVTSGGNVTLQCGSWVGFDRFILMTSHGGRYTCYGGQNLSSAWSAPSDPLDILVAGQLPYRPSLSVQPGPTVTSGQNVTLLCQSWSSVDTFLLSKEGAADPPLRLRSKHRAGQHQAEFSMSPVTSAHGGTYRCYGSLSTSPYLLSQPSDPLELLVSGERPLTLTIMSSTSSRCTCQESLTQDYTVENLIRMGVAVLILLVLGILLLDAQHSLTRTPDAALLEPETGDAMTPTLTALLCLGTLPKPTIWAEPGSVIPRWTPVTIWCRGSLETQEYRLHKEGNSGTWDELKPLEPGDKAKFSIRYMTDQNTRDEDPQGLTRAQVSHSRSRLRRGLAPSPSPVSGALLDSEDRQAEEDRQTDCQAATSHAPSDVTYAQLNRLTLRRETSASPPSQPGEPPAEPSVYAALALR